LASYPGEDGIELARAADEWRLEKERTKEQRATMRVRIPVAAGMSDSIFLMDGVVGSGGLKCYLYNENIEQKTPYLFYIKI